MKETNYLRFTGKAHEWNTKETMKPTEFKCDQCEKSFTEDQMTATGGDEIYCQTCWPEKVAEAEEAYGSEPNSESIQTFKQQYIREN